MRRLRRIGGRVFGIVDSSFLTGRVSTKPGQLHSRLAPLAFRCRPNATRLVERHGYRTPAQVRADQLGALAAAA